MIDESVSMLHNLVIHFLDDRWKAPRMQLAYIQANVCGLNSPSNLGGNLRVLLKKEEQLHADLTQQKFMRHDQELDEYDELCDDRHETSLVKEAMFCDGFAMDRASSRVFRRKATRMPPPFRTTWQTLIGLKAAIATLENPEAHGPAAELEQLKDALMLLGCKFFELDSARELLQRKACSFKLQDIVALDSKSIFMVPSASNDNIQSGLRAGMYVPFRALDTTPSMNEVQLMASLYVPENTDTSMNPWGV